MSHIFISYAREDEEKAIRIKKYLKRKFFQVWFDKEQMVTEINIDKAIERGIADSNCILILLSNGSNGKKSYNHYEWQLAKKRDPKSLLILLKLEPCDTHPFWGFENDYRTLEIYGNNGISDLGRLLDRNFPDPIDGRELTDINNPKIDRFYGLRKASREDMDWIANLEIEKYTAIDAIPYRKLIEWYSANPSGFFVILEGKKRIGHIDILPIRSCGFKDFKEGKVFECDIEGKCVIPKEEKGDIKDLYIESLIIDKNLKTKRGSVILYLLSRIISIAKCIAEPENIKNVYAISASDNGAKIIKNVGFELSLSKERREDKHDFYRVHFPDLIEKVKEFIKDYNPKEADDDIVGL